MKTVHILTDGFTSPNGVAFLFPLIKFNHAITNKGYNITLFNEINDEITDCDILCLDGKFFDSWWLTRFDDALETIQKLKKSNALFWFDQSDSSGTLLGKVLPFVDKYYKSQILADKTQYQQTHYAARIFLDYYHNQYGVQDNGTYIKQPVEKIADLQKIGVSWNSGLMNYGWISPYLTRVLKYAPLKMLMQFSNYIREADAKRTLDVSCRMGLSHSRNTIVFHRKQIRDKLIHHVKTDRISRKQYLNEIKNSKICVSPFGFGEITLKDFETFLLGALLIKPDMSHMYTWPNFFENEQTCLFHDWSNENLIELIEEALINNQKRTEIAQNAQDRYLRHTTDKQAPELFAQHFDKLMKAV